jgi:pyruvate,orthophosphate dikinase
MVMGHQIAAGRKRDQMKNKWVYLFNEVENAMASVNGNWEDVRGLLGGKGANLGEMMRIGLPVPPGFTITTEACKAYLDAGGTFPEGMWEEVLNGLVAIEDETGKKFGANMNPLLLSCRSGAKFSMPGMMDTVLNIGLNDETVKSLIDLTGDPRFVYDAYRRFIQMFGSVVMGVPSDRFEDKITEARSKTGAENDAQLAAGDWKRVGDEFKSIYWRHTHSEFPEDPYAQLKSTIAAVFKSWNGKRAIAYRNAAKIKHDLGTAVNMVTMVFGNMGDDCATGVAMTRNGSTGEKQIEGDYLTNAQGEDVVAGIRKTKDISLLKTEMPEAFEEIKQISQRLENHYREMQDIEFTIEKGKLWMLQTRDGKRTAPAAVRIAVEMAKEGLITKEEAVLRVQPEQIDFFLHPQFDREAIASAKANDRLIGTGLNVSPGAANGIVSFSADLAVTWDQEEKKKVILVRPETKPDDVHGMLAAQGIVTSRGGRTSHAALVARQFGKPAVVGVSELDIDLNKHQMCVHGALIKEGEWISIDGTSGEVFAGELNMTVPEIDDPWLVELLSWADGFRRLGIWANADYPADAERARAYGAEGIGLCRTEHMFFETERLPYLHKMIMTDLPVERKEALDALLPFQREDFEGLLRAMDGLPVILRLIDPPLHEFLPNHVELRNTLTDLKIRLNHAETLENVDSLLQQINHKEKILKRVEILSEQNPMLGLRGVRLGIHIPELTAMQVRAIFQAACNVSREGIEVHPEIMIPLTSHVNELKLQREQLEGEANKVMAEEGMTIDYKFGTMIELPRACLTADQLVRHAAFISFGTNDLTQTTFGISRDDAESGFLIKYLRTRILPNNPFETIDPEGVGALMEMAIEKGRSVKPDLECGICGEHGGDPESIALCHNLGLTYVSCSPFRVPIARLAAAHAALHS